MTEKRLLEPVDEFLERHPLLAAVIFASFSVAFLFVFLFCVLPLSEGFKFYVGFAVTAVLFGLAARDAYDQFKKWKEGGD